MLDKRQACLPALFTKGDEPVKTGALENKRRVARRRAMHERIIGKRRDVIIAPFFFYNNRRMSRFQAWKICHEACNPPVAVPKGMYAGKRNVQPRVRFKDFIRVFPSIAVDVCVQSTRSCSRRFFLMSSASPSRNFMERLLRLGCSVPVREICPGNCTIFSDITREAKIAHGLTSCSHRFSSAWCRAGSAPRMQVLLRLRCVELPRLSSWVSRRWRG